MRVLDLIATCFIAGLVELAPAQIDSLRMGDGVRLITETSLNPTEWQYGEITALDTAGLTIGMRSRRVPLQSRFNEIDRLQVSLGTSSRRGFKYLVTGGALGFVVGAGLSLLS